MPKKPATKAERKHFDRILENGCLICGRPAEIHHLLSVRPRNHKWVVPLCPDHHRFGPDGLHFMGNEKKFFKRHGIDEIEWAAEQWEISDG